MIENFSHFQIGLGVMWWWRLGKTVEVVQLAQGLLGGSYRKIFTELDLMARKGVWKKKEKKRSLEANERATSEEGFEAPEEKCARMLISC